MLSMQVPHLRHLVYWVLVSNALHFVKNNNKSMKSVFELIASRDRRLNNVVI